MKRMLALVMPLWLTMLAATPMNVMGEVFTEVCTGCGGDYSIARSALIQLSQEYERLFPVIWQLSDPQSPGAADRYNWYGGTEVPHAVFSGAYEIEGLYDPLNDYYGAYMTAYALESQLEITMEAHRNGDGDMQLLATIEVTGNVVTNDNEVFFLVTQNDLSNYHGLVMAKTDNQPISLTGRTELEHVFPWDNSWDELDMRGLIVVQSYDTGEVVQTQQAKITAVAVDDDDVQPVVGAAVRVWPNPFNPETTVSLSLSSEESRRPVSLAVYDVRGRKVRTLVDDEMVQPQASVLWNGRDDSGRQVASGVYLAVLRTSQRNTASRMILMK